jgi:hypothetical protein
LPALWLRGAWSGLALAAGFALLLNALVATTLVWTQWVDAHVRLVGWVALLTVWLAALVADRMGWKIDRVAAWGRVRMRHRPAGLPAAHAVGGESLGDLFREAQLQYLRGNWLQAENLLRHLVQADPGDVEARLMLVTLCRHMGRSDEAIAQLRRLARLEDAARWRREMDAERALLVRLPTP